MIVILIFIGIIIGSFLNNYISYLCGFSRFDLKRSTCLCNERDLKPNELIPVLSYIMIQGKCTECGKKISTRYIFIEILTPIVITSFYLVFNNPLHFILYASLSLILIVIAVVDFYKFKIPDQAVVIIVLLSIIKFLYEKNFTIDNLLPVLIIFLLFSLINSFHYKLKNKYAIGFGDIKLLMALGLFFSPLFSFFGIWASSFIAIPGFILLKISSKGNYSGNKVPFGLFISITYVILLFIQKEILVYINSLGGL